MRNDSCCGFGNWLLIAAAGLAPFFVNADVCWDEAFISGHTPGEKCFFAPGEEMAFTLKIEGAKGELPPDAFFVKWTRTGDDGKTETGKVAASLTEPFTVKTRLDQPGFVRLEAEVVDRAGRRVPKKHRWEKRVFFGGGAGVDVDKLAGWPEPADFDAHWYAEKAKLAALPMKTLEKREIGCSNPGLRLFAVKVNVPDGYLPMTGYLVVPKAASVTAPTKATVQFMGYGNEPQRIAADLTNRVDGVRLVVNRHGEELGNEDPAYRKQFETCPRIISPDYFRGMVFRDLRALQFVKSLPEWNGRELVASGGSGGGMQALWMGALDEDVSLVDCNAPCFGNLGGFRLGQLKAGFRPAWSDEVAYYDICNFARRIRREVKITFAGLGDYTSPPNSLAIVWNNLRCKKEITWYQGCTHGWRPSGMARVTLRDDGGWTDRTAEGDPLDRVRTALARGERKVTIPRGRYYVSPKDFSDDSHRREDAPDTLPARPRAGEGDVYLKLRGVKDFEIDFGGSELVGLVRTRMLDLEGCTNVTIRGLYVDYKTLPFTQAVIRKVDAEKSWDVEIVDGYPGDDAPGGQFIDNHDSFWPIQAYDGKTYELKNKMRFQDNVAIRRTGPRTFRISGGKDRRGDVGDIAVWSLKEPGRKTLPECIHLDRCANCTFSDVTEFATAHGRSFIEFFSASNRYERCRVVRCPPRLDTAKRALPRLRSGNHDGFIGKCDFVGPRLVECRAEYHCDDSVNISGMYSLVTEVGSDGELRTLRDWFNAGLRVGDSVQVMYPDGTCPPDSTVVSVRPLGPATAADAAKAAKLGIVFGLAKGLKEAFAVRLDRAIPGLGPGAIVMSNAMAGDGFLIRNCTFGSTRARGLLLKASRGRVESSTIRHAVSVTTEYDWLSGGCSSDLVFVNNRVFDGVRIGGSACSTAKAKELPASAHRNLVFDANTVFTGAFLGVGCTGLTLRGNAIAPLPDGRDVVLRNCEDVRK